MAENDNTNGDDDDKQDDGISRCPECGKMPFQCDCPTHIPDAGDAPPAGEGKLSIDAVALVYETRVAVESVSAGVELLAKRDDLPAAARAELSVLAKLARQASEAFATLQDALWQELGIAGMSGQN